jgi:lipoprotein-releasing system permease protein
LQAGFEWFVAWRYLRTRSRRPSLVPLLVGLTLVVFAVGAFYLSSREPLRPILRLGDIVEYRRLYLGLGVFTVLGGFLTLVIGIERMVRHRAEGALDAWRRAAVVFWAFFVTAAGVGLTAAATIITTLRHGGWIERDAKIAQAAGAVGTGLLVVSVVASVVGLAWWRRWRHTPDADERSGEARAMHAWITAAGVLVAVGLLYQAVGARPDAAEERARLLSVMDWRRVLESVGILCMVLGGLVSVFSAFFLLQSIFTTISTFGVFLGTWALCVALSVMNGFEVDLRQKILGSNAHVLVTKEDGSFTEWRDVQRQLEGVPGLVATTPYVASEVVVAANSNYSGVIIKGIDPRTVGAVTDLKKNLQKGSRLENMWPLAEDGGPIEYAHGGDAGPLEIDTDAGPPDFDDSEPPPDFSGGEEPAAPAGDEPADEPAEEPAIDDSEPPPDFSGEGEETAAEADGEEVDTGEDAADAGAAVATAGDAGPKLERDRFMRRESDLLELGVGAPTIIGGAGRESVERPLDPRVAGLDGILVGRELSKNLHLYVGQEVQVVSPIAQVTPQGEVPRVRSFRVAGIFFSGMYEYDTKFAYVTVPAMQSFLSLGDEVTGIEIKVRDRDRTEPVVRAIAERLGPAYKVQDWKEINRSLFSALKLEKIAMFLVLTIIILVASFSIISNLIMVVVEKAREIAILKAQGASDGGVMRTFMIEGLYIGLLGTIVGISLGVLSCWALDHFGLPLDSEVYYIDKLPVAMDTVAIVLVAVAGVAISFIATIYPSWLAARMRPVDGLRYE